MSWPTIMAANARKSKKPSDANLNSPPETTTAPLVFFVDRSLGRKIISGALRDAGEEVRIHDELFSQDAKDERSVRSAAQSSNRLKDPDGVALTGCPESSARGLDRHFLQNAPAQLQPRAAHLLPPRQARVEWHYGACG